MSEKEQKVLENTLENIKQLDSQQRKEILMYTQGMVDMKKNMQSKQENKQPDAYRAI